MIQWKDVDEARRIISNRKEWYRLSKNNDFVMGDVPKGVQEVLEKEKNRLEEMEKTTVHPYIRNVCKKRQDLIKLYLGGTINSR